MPYGLWCFLHWFAWSMGLGYRALEFNASNRNHAMQSCHGLLLANLKKANSDHFPVQAPTVLSDKVSGRKGLGLGSTMVYV